MKRFELARMCAGVGVSLGVLIAAGVAAAQDAPDLDWSAGFTVATENTGKGLGKSGGDPSVAGFVGVAWGALYGEFGGSTVELGGGAETELVTTVGWAPEVGAYSFDLSAMHKVLTGTVPGYDNAYMEYQADVSRDVGPVGLRLRVNYTPDGSGATEEAWWIEAQGGVALDSRTRATAAIGERITDTGAEYTAWNIGVKRRLVDHVALDVRWYDTDRHALGERYEDRLVAALSFNF